MSTHKSVTSRLARAPFLRKKPAIIAVASFALVSIVLIALSRAATSTAPLETESMALTPPATVIEDAGASGGKGIRFAAASTNPNPNPNPNPTPNTNYKQLSNPNASQQAKNVYYFLQSIEGKSILAGQHEQDQCTNCESDRMKSITGKLPAVHGHDVADYAADPIQEAINDWNVRKQLPTFSWHVSAPGTSEDWNNVNTGADVNATVTSGTSQNASLMTKLDKMAGRLQTLEDANVPVLWRPWHEMDGDWFWWSKSGPDAYKKLWTITYDYFTKTKGLDNLIWVWSDSEAGPPSPDWYPGDQYVDIMGSDTYDSRTSIDNLRTHFQTHKQIAPNKPVAHTETDIILDPDELKNQQIKLIWFLPWYGQWVNENGNDNLTRIYNHSYVITADEMPDLKTTFQ